MLLIYYQSMYIFFYIAVVKSCVLCHVTLILLFVDGRRMICWKVRRLSNRPAPPKGQKLEDFPLTCPLPICVLFPRNTVCYQVTKNKEYIYLSDRDRLLCKLCYMCQVGEMEYNNWDLHLMPHAASESLIKCLPCIKTEKCIMWETIYCSANWKR